MSFPIRQKEHYSDVTWASWRLQSSATELFLNSLFQIRTQKVPVITSSFVGGNYLPMLNFNDTKPPLKLRVDE